MSMRVLAGLGFFSVTAALLGSACSGGPAADGTPTGTPTSPPNRGGMVTITRSFLASGSPEKSVSGAAQFYAPPGPDDDSLGWPDSGTCAWVTPQPTPTSVADVSWKDAGDSVVLKNASAALDFDRFAAGNAIVYLTRADADPDAIEPEASYDLEISGSTESNGLPAAMISGALEMPPPIGVSLPDFSSGPVMLPRTPLQVEWISADVGLEVLVSLSINGGVGSTATLRCVTPDVGLHVFDMEQMSALPPGAGVLSVSRARTTVGPLSPSTSLVGRGIWIEGGAIELP